MMIDVCDICGRETRVAKYRIEGAEVIACQNCGRHGTLIEDNAPKAKATTYNSSYPPSNYNKPSSSKPKENPQQNYVKKGEKVLLENYGQVIASARDKMGITRQELAKSLFIRETLLMRIETEKVRPSDDLIKKLEKALNIILFEESSEGASQQFGNQPAQARSMTLGDFATIKKSKKE
jgi:putative transcription factor